MVRSRVSLLVPLFLSWLLGCGTTADGASRFLGRTSSIPAVHKCCPRDQALLSGRGCIRSSSQPSAYLTHLQNTMSVRVGFPVPRNTTCAMMLLRRDIKHVATWWISRVGLLAVEAPQGELAIHNYCLDDLIDPATNTASPSAVTCVHELNGEVQLPLSAFRSKTVGKCCARDQHYSHVDQTCQTGAEGIPDWEVPVPGADNETQLGYTGFPGCPSRKYSTFYFENSTKDHVRLASNLSLLVIRMNGHCVEKEVIVNLKDYCFDYEWDGSGEAKPLAVICHEPEKEAFEAEQQPALLVLLSLSSIALILTIVFLVALQAKGIVRQVSQAGPLAPRTHITYVCSMLLSFIVFAAASGLDANERSALCKATGGFLLFFILCGFHWNTALCVESLLIIMRYGVPGWRRYFVHCCWACGVPALFTIIAMSLDANSEKLSCSAILPRVGKFKCFFSDPDAHMVYLYMPIFITLAVNLVTLWAGRHIRDTRLRRLELGAKHHNKRHGAAGGTGNGKSSTLEEGISATDIHRRQLGPTYSSGKGSNSSIARFGLSTRETQKLWWEAVCLALWSAVTVGMEVIGFSIAGYGYLKEGQWLEHLWYIPTAVNALRGLGVFLILVVLPKDSRTYSLELVSSVWEKCGGKPLRDILPSTRQSSTSTNTTATTTATASPVAPGDKERISLSSSDTQLSSHTASMSELHELPRSGDNGVSPSVNKDNSATTSTSLSTKPAFSSGFSKKSRDLKSPKKKHSNGDDKTISGSSSRNDEDSKNSVGTHLEKLGDRSVDEEAKSANENSKAPPSPEGSSGDINESVKNISESYPKKNSLGLPTKPPRKSLDLSTRASLSLDNISQIPHDEKAALATPPKSPSPSLNENVAHLSSANDLCSPETPPNSIPPSPPNSPPPFEVDDKGVEFVQLPMRENDPTSITTATTCDDAEIRVADTDDVRTDVADNPQTDSAAGTCSVPLDNRDEACVASSSPATKADFPNTGSEYIPNDKSEGNEGAFSDNGYDKAESSPKEKSGQKIDDVSAESCESTSEITNINS
ncbi:GPCR family 2 secretin-like [Trinorchestia longiramus]|nr:GPCR family 2 secretin-like [Trinorchestia longiramus]